MCDDIASNRPMPSQHAKTTNILTFDGGGVRGLSSLIILKRLMTYVNQQDGLPPGGLTPKDLFGLVAGTSTGGLIALMLGRFGMSVDDCIAQYFDVSKEIFGHYSRRGRWSRGLLKDRYDGRRLRNSVRKLAAREDTCDDQSVLMQGPGHTDGIPCTVLAAEFDGDDIRDEPAYLCTHNCDSEFECRVCDAAQATAAAPGYFPLCRIGGRSFIDGGFGHNNPSYDIYTHYTHVRKHHVFPRVEMNKILMVNIGTGIDRRHVRQSEDQGRPRSPRTPAKQPTQSPTGLANMLRQMKSHTTNTQAQFYILKTISQVNEDMLVIHRFTADTGLHKIKLDAYRKLQDIEKLTNEYLDRPEVGQELMEVAKKLVHGWKQQQTPPAEPVPVGDHDVVAPPVTVPYFPDGHHVELANIRPQAAPRPIPPPGVSTPRQDPVVPLISPPAPPVTPPALLAQPPPPPSPHQPSPSTGPASTIGADPFGEDAIDVGPASDRAEPSDTTRLTIQERTHDPLPDTLPPQTAYATGSLNGSTAADSPNRISVRDDSLQADINNKELGMALGGQFAPPESLL